MADNKTSPKSEDSVTLKAEKDVYTVFKKDGTTVQVEANTTTESLKKAEAKKEE